MSDSLRFDSLVAWGNKAEFAESFSCVCVECFSIDSNDFLIILKLKTLLFARVLFVIFSTYLVFNYSFFAVFMEKLNDL